MDYFMPGLLEFFKKEPLHTITSGTISLSVPKCYRHSCNHSYKLSCICTVLREGIFVAKDDRRMTLSSKSMSNHFKRPISAGRIPANAAMHIYNLCTGGKEF